MPRKMLGFAGFVATGVGLLAVSLLRGESIYNGLILLIIAAFFGTGLIDHFKELQK